MCPVVRCFPHRRPAATAPYSAGEARIVSPILLPICLCNSAMAVISSTVADWWGVSLQISGCAGNGAPHRIGKPHRRVLDITGGTPCLSTGMCRRRHHPGMTTWSPGRNIARRAGRSQPSELDARAKAPRLPPAGPPVRPELRAGACVFRPPRRPPTPSWAKACWRESARSAGRRTGR